MKNLRNANFDPSRMRTIACFIIILASVLIGGCTRNDSGAAAATDDSAVAARRRATGSGDELVIRWHGSRGLPNADATIISLLEELLSGRLGYRVRFELTGTDEGNHHPQLHQMLAANDLPDCFLYMSLDEEFLSEAAAKFELPELFVHMPEMTKYLRELMNRLGLPEGTTWSTYIDDADGRMWGVPRTWDYGWVPSGQMWRTDLLAELGYRIPETIEEADRVFAAYKARFPTKYVTGGSGKEPTWQCFDLVWNAFGLVAAGQHLRHGTVVEFFADDRFLEALSVLRRWYESGYIDREFLKHTNLDKFARFARGDYLVTEWVGRGDWDFMSGETTGYFSALRNIAGAEAVAATHLAADRSTKPVQRVWNPFLTQVSVFGKHLEGDREKIHRIMEVADLISQDREVKYLSNYGIESVHYRIDEGEIAPTSIAVPGAGSPIKVFGYGYYWGGTFSTASPLRTRDQRVIDEYATDPDGIYGSNRLDLWFPIVEGPVVYENDERVEVETLSGWFEMVVAVMTGAEPLEYYRDWLAYYYQHGGKEWEREATRLYAR